MPFHGGLDWGGTSHAVCVIDGAGQVIVRIEAHHDAAGLADMLARLRRVATPAELPIAIERPSGLTVDALVAAGHPVMPIHPNVVKACRPRYCAAGGKSDPGDAYMLADILRTDGHRFRPLMPASDDIKALRALVRGRDDLVAQRVALANQLRSLLEGFWPGAGAIFAAIDSPIALAFVGRYPTPDSASRLGEKRLASSWPNTPIADAVPPPNCSPACGPHRPAWPAMSRPTPKAKSSAPWLPSSNASSPRSPSCPRASNTPSPNCPMAKSSCRSRAPAASAPPRSWPNSATCANASNRRSTRRRGRVLPVTHASGKSRGRRVPLGLQQNLRLAVTCFADNSRHACAWAAGIYTRARQRGCKHPHAVRILARAWIRVLWRAWQNRKAYDPAQHASAAQNRRLKISGWTQGVFHVLRSSARPPDHAMMRQQPKGAAMTAEREKRLCAN